MIRATKSFTISVIAGAACLGGTTVAAMSEDASPPNFAPNPSIGWYAYNRLFIPPTTGAGPVMQDPAHPYVSNDEIRVSGQQPTERVANLSTPYPAAVGAGGGAQAQRSGAVRKVRCLPDRELLAERRHRLSALAHDPADVFHPRAQGRGHGVVELQRRSPCPSHQQAFRQCKAVMVRRSPSAITKATPWWLTPSDSMTALRLTDSAPLTPRSFTSSSAST